MALWVGNMATCCRELENEFQIMLKIPRSIADEMSRHAVAEYSEECCGVLLGRKDADARVVTDAIACRNARAGTGKRYEIAPQELIAAQRRAREQGLAIVGFYHSHPDHPAEPSSTDAAEAHWPDCAYVIIPVTQHGAGAPKAYVLGSNPPLRPEALEI